MTVQARRQLALCRGRRRLLSVLLVQDLADSLIALQEIVGARAYGGGACAEHVGLLRRAHCCGGSLVGACGGACMSSSHGKMCSVRAGGPCSDEALVVMQVGSLLWPTRERLLCAA